MWEEEQGGRGAPRSGGLVRDNIHLLDRIQSPPGDYALHSVKIAVFSGIHIWLQLQEHRTSLCLCSPTPPRS